MDTTISEEVNIGEMSSTEEPTHGLIDWILTIPFVLAFFLVLIVFDPMQRIAIRFGRKAHERVIIWLNRWLVNCLYIVRAKVTYKVFGKLTVGQPVIAIANHQSLFDIPIMHTILGSHFPRFIAKKELARWIPSVSYNLRRGGNAIIDRSNARQAVGAIEELGSRMVDQNFAAVIFPEGTRAREGELKKFRVAGVATLLQMVPHAQIIPVTIDGAWKLARFNGFPVPVGVEVRIIVGAAVDRSETHSLKELISMMQEITSSTLNRLRTDPTFGTDERLI